MHLEEEVASHSPIKIGVLSKEHAKETPYIKKLAFLFVGVSICLAFFMDPSTLSKPSKVT